METVEGEARFRLKAGCCPADALAQLGVCLGEPIHQDDQAYAPAGWDYGQDRIQVTFARLRSQGDRTLFTVKRPVTHVRTCVEHECRVDADQVEGVGTFIEVEVMADPGEDHEGLREEHERLVERLELDVERCPETYDALVHATGAAASLLGPTIPAR